MSRPEDCRPTLARHNSNCLGTVAIVESLRAKLPNQQPDCQGDTDLYRVPRYAVVALEL